MRRGLGVLLLASLVVFFAGLGRAAIGDSDEAFYAEAAREMVQSGNWLTPFYNYEERFQKPILYYWLAAAAFRVAGPTEAAARFPAACSGVALVILTWACARRWRNERVALLAGLIAATNFGYFALGRLALPDLPLAAFMTLTTWAGLEAARAYGEAAQASRGRHGLPWLLLASVGAALAFLTKGPVGFALPALTILIATRTGLVGPPRWLPAPPATLAVALVVFLALGAPWYVAMVNEHGLGYLHRFFVGENMERFATDRYNEPQSLLFYVPVLLGGLLPWSPFMGAWIPAWLRAWRTRTLALTALDFTLIVWALVPFVFYSLSIGKQPRYILPVLPPVAILLATSLRSLLDADDRRRLLTGLGAVAGLLFVVLGGLLLRTLPLLASLTPPTTGAVAVAIIASGVVVAAVAASRPHALPWAVAAASILTLLGLHYSVFSSHGMEPVQRLAAAYSRVRTNDEPSATHRVFVRNLVFYTGVAQTDLARFEDLVAFLSRPERVVGVLRQRDLDRLAREHGIQPKVHFSVRYFNTATTRMKSLFFPDPGRDLEHVHLVTNH